MNWEKSLSLSNTRSINGQDSVDLFTIIQDFNYSGPHTSTNESLTSLEDSQHSIQPSDFQYSPEANYLEIANHITGKEAFSKISKNISLNDVKDVPIPTRRRRKQICVEYKNNNKTILEENNFNIQRCERNNRHINFYIFINKDIV